MERISAKQYCIEKGTIHLLMQSSIPENSQLNMETISYASHRRIWWQCSKGHKWQSTMSDRLVKD
ncbi:MAG: zinc-ribbon domain-containing protein, partial [Lachnospiraceae bacterium]|nr:zinc-ribbon domain-containing protein [Lachnospiraceae bacterium]